MATIYSVEFAEVLVDATDPIVLHVPDGHVYVLRDMEARGEGIGSIQSSGIRFASPGEAGAWFMSFTRAFLPDYGDAATWSWEGRQVFEAGQTLRAHPIGTAGIYTLRACGYDLTAP
jgi:hypothetical protein